MTNQNKPKRSQNISIRNEDASKPAGTFPAPCGHAVGVVDYHYKFGRGYAVYYYCWLCNEGGETILSELPAGVARDYQVIVISQRFYQEG